MNEKLTPIVTFVPSTTMTTTTMTDPYHQYDPPSYLPLISGAQNGSNMMTLLTSTSTAAAAANTSAATKKLNEVSGLLQYTSAAGATAVSVPPPPTTITPADAMNINVSMGMGLGMTTVVPDGNVVMFSGSDIGIGGVTSCVTKTNNKSGINNTRMTMATMAATTTATTIASSSSNSGNMNTGSHHHKTKRKCCCSCFGDSVQSSSSKLTKNNRTSKPTKSTSSLWVGLITNLGICLLLFAYTLLGSFIFLTIENEDSNLLHSQQRTLASTKRQSSSLLTKSRHFDNLTTISNNFIDFENSETISTADNTYDVRQRTIENIWDITVSLNILYKENWTKLAALEIAKFQDQLIKRLNEDAALSSSVVGGDNNNSPATEPVLLLPHHHGQQQQYEWNFAKAFLYSLTVLTTIGYGNIAPKTTLGRLVTLAYAILGIPLTLVYLSSTGGVLARIAREVFSRALCCCLCSNCGYCCYDEKRMAEKERRMKRRRQQEEIRKQQAAMQEPYYVRSSPGSLHSGLHSPEKQLPTQQQPLPIINGGGGGGGAFGDIDDSLSASESRGSMHGLSILAPILLCLSMMIIYIILGALALYRLENWPILDGIYFCFMSLSTIGFGDLVPGLRKESTTTTWFCSIYIMSGMALTAMCFNVIHEEIVHRIKIVVEFKKSEAMVSMDTDDGNFYTPP